MGEPRHKMVDNFQNVRQCFDTFGTQIMKKTKKRRNKQTNKEANKQNKTKDNKTNKQANKQNKPIIYHLWGAAKQSLGKDAKDDNSFRIYYLGWGGAEERGTMKDQLWGGKCVDRVHSEPR